MVYVGLNQNNLQCVCSQCGSLTQMDTIKMFFTCAENESVCDTEKHTEVPDTTALPPTLPPLELDPVGESGSAAPQRGL